MATYSFHTFMFPFRWKIKTNEELLFSEQINLNKINYTESTEWERTVLPQKDKENDDLYNERNYFYEFVHPALYDDGSSISIIRHYERREPKKGGVTYCIVCGEDKRQYILDVQAINLNLYSTGVGVLSIYLNNNLYPNENDVLAINQFGRRVFPAFINDVNLRLELAHSIGFEGLNGVYKEDFSNYHNGVSSNTPASFITKMIHEVAINIDLQPVVDDRMFVLSWYKNDDFSNQFNKNNDSYDHFLYDDWWYKYVFVDGNYKTCPNDKMSHQLIENATYPRWQQWGTLYGVSRYSMMMLTGNGCPDYLTVYFETEYARMAELVLMQRATVLRFSSEITSISKISGRPDLSNRVSSLYKEYIRFVNQIYFREISAQDQGIEMYQKLYSAMNIQEQVEKLDNEIEELHNYVTIHEEQKTNRTMSLLSWMATIFVPITAVTGIFNMNNSALHLTDCETESLKWYNYASSQFLLIGISTILFIVITLLIKNRRTK